MHTHERYNNRKRYILVYEQLTIVYIIDRCSLLAISAIEDAKCIDISFYLRITLVKIVSSFGFCC